MLRSHRRIFIVALFAGLTGLTPAADAPKAVPGKPPAGPNDAELVERVIAARKEYQASLVALYEQYIKAGDRERTANAGFYHHLVKPVQLGALLLALGQPLQDAALVG